MRAGSILQRAWALEATWHPERMQGLGVLYALLPLLGRQRDLPAALQRHAACFNCNLWTAPALLGAMARLESEDRGAEAILLRDRLAAPLSGAGDVHVWTAVRPACLVLVLLGALVGHPLAGLGLAALLHDGALLWRRRRGFERGWARGAELERDFAAVRPDPRFTRWLQTGIVFLAGALAAWGLGSGWAAAPSRAFLMSGALLVGYYAARKQLSPGMTFLLLVALASLLRRFSNPVGLP